MSLAILFLFVNNTKSQCPVFQDCQNKEFLYEFCDHSKIPPQKVTQCASNPFYSKNSGGNLLTPLKLDLDCIQYQSSTYLNVPFSSTIVHFEAETTYVWVPHKTVIGYYENLDNPDDPLNGSPIYWVSTGEHIYSNNDLSDDEGYFSLGSDILFQCWTHDISNIIDAHDETVVINGNESIKNEFGLEVFNYNDVQSNIQSAISAWKSHCSMSNNLDVQHCCVQILWTQDPDIFSNGGNNPSTTRAQTSRPLKKDGSCDYDCSNMSITLNQTDYFTGSADPNNPVYSKNFFITGSNQNKFQTTSPDKETNYWWSLTSVVAHELGHLLGFGDQTSGVACRRQGSLMNNGDPLDPSNTGNNVGYDFSSPFYGLNEDDVCMYEKLWCCDAPLGVHEENTTENRIEIFPNPSNTKMINVQFGNPSGMYMSYEIVSPIGNIVSTGIILPNESTKTITLKNLASGIYFIILKYGDKKEVKKFVISN